MSRRGGWGAAACALTLGLAAIVAGVAIAPTALERWAVGTTSGTLAWGPWLFKALLVWRFAALPGGAEQWGRITFNYRLGDAR